MIRALGLVALSGFAACAVTYDSSEPVSPAPADAGEDAAQDVRPASTPPEASTSETPGVDAGVDAEADAGADADAGPPGLPRCTGAVPTMTFDEGFEDGTTGVNWSESVASGGVASVTSTIKKTGTYALKIASTALSSSVVFGKWLTYFACAPLRVRCSYAIFVESRSYGGAASDVLLQPDPSSTLAYSSEKQWFGRLDFNNLYLDLSSGKGSYGAAGDRKPPPVALGVWHAVSTTVFFGVGDQNSTQTSTIDDTTKLSSTIHTTPTRFLAASFGYSGTGGGHVQYMDDIHCDIGPGE